MAGIQDALGLRGEAIFRVLLTKFDLPTGPRFNPHFLGDKWGTVDFLVELTGASPVTPFFFAQVRATRKGLTADGSRLRAGVTAAQIRALIAYPAPTYVFGIDAVSERGYIVSPHPPRDRAPAGIASIPTGYVVDSDTRRALWEEVRAFWTGYNPATVQSRFVDPAWRL